MKYQEWIAQPTRFLAMTGYTIEQFNALLPYFEVSHQNHFTKYYLNGQARSEARKYVIYQNSPLASPEERLVFILCYQKLNPLQEDQADRFGMTQAQCNQWVHALKLILDQSLIRAGAMPAQTQAELDQKLEQMQAETPEESELILLHDATEREVPRPSDSDLQKEKYSGKKKYHTAKNAVICTAVCLILYVSPTIFGAMHDKKMADTYYTIRKGFTLWQDTGYQGYAPEGVKIVQPTKKPRGKELTEEQKKANQAISSFRVRVEHAIGSVKRIRIVKDECRLRKNNFVEKIFLTATALHNFRLRLNPFQYKTN